MSKYFLLHFPTTVHFAFSAAMRCENQEKFRSQFLPIQNHLEQFWVIFLPMLFTKLDLISIKKHSNKESRKKKHELKIIFCSTFRQLCTLLLVQRCAPKIRRNLGRNLCPSRIIQSRDAHQASKNGLVSANKSLIKCMRLPLPAPL